MSLRILVSSLAIGIGIGIVAGCRVTLPEEPSYVVTVARDAGR